MRNYVDLHTHSNVSDGQLRPAEVVRLAERKRLAAVALTDHDSADGLAEAEAAARALPIRFVRGVEISASFSGGTMHIVGLGIDPANRRLRSAMGRLVRARQRRNPKVVAKLRAMGVDVTLEQWRAWAGDCRMVGRLHMAKLLCAKGYARDVGDAFRRYIGAGAPAFVDKELLSPREAIEAIHAAGGLAVLAHPPELNYGSNARLERIVRSLVRDGLDGIEAIHSEHSPAQTRHYLALAGRLGLLVSGGSDFHGPDQLDNRVGLPRVPLAAVEELLARIHC
ncbi:MAG: hypothetical protein B1H04_00755 [Planctomycetales bacterium 4484_123]|nr:MAG: hypothetical protein B1H04_00755 [Planctomycetales bacterium 4484_123]